MKIQVVTFDKDKYASLIGSEIVCNNLINAESFDNFDYNIIDLTNRLLWLFYDVACENLTNMQMVNHIKKMINSTENNVIIILPGNINIKYHYNSNTKRYYGDAELKDKIPSLKSVLKKFFIDEFESIKIIYEKNYTKLNNNELSESSFYFELSDKDYIYKTTNNRKKVVTMRLGKNKNIYVTTLNSIIDDNLINNVLEGLLGIVIYEEPEWVKDVNFYTDEELNEKNLQLELKIDEIQQKIEENIIKLNKNKEFKKILYTNADILVEQVTKILEEMLNFDCSDFIDVKKEDMRIKLNDTTFIFEIKGENDGVKQSNISQLTTHIELYEESLEEAGEEKENIKGILIKNEFKNKPVTQREPVHNNVIQKAQRSKCLIITSKLLLDLFEKYLRQDITTDQVKEIFKTQIGLLDLNNL